MLLFVQCKDAEKTAIVEGIKENGVDDGDKVIRSVLAERHALEMRNLEKEYAAQKKIMVDDAINKLAEKYDTLRDEMSQKHEAELSALKVCVRFLPLDHTW